MMPSTIVHSNKSLARLSSVETYRLRPNLLEAMVSMPSLPKVIDQTSEVLSPAVSMTPDLPDSKLSEMSRNGGTSSRRKRIDIQRFGEVWSDWIRKSRRLWASFRNWNSVDSKFRTIVAYSDKNSRASKICYEISRTILK